MTRTPFWLAGAAALLVLVAANALMAEVPLDSSPILTVASGPETVIRAGDVEIGSRDFAINQTRNRPLFAPSRRIYVEPPPPPKQEQPAPVQSVEKPQPPPPPPAPQIRLFGVQMTPSGRKALLVHGNSSEPEWLEEGSEVGGWRISAVTPDGIEIGLGEQSVQVDLHAPDR
jgi:hypothetical protein